MKSILALIGVVRCGIPLEFKEVPSKGIINDDTTIDISPSNSFGNCLCDLTKGGCDSGCCCDPDCPADIV